MCLWKTRPPSPDTYVYNNRGWLVSETKTPTSGQAEVTTYEYDQRGNQTQRRITRGNMVVETQNREYNIFDQLTKMTTADMRADYRYRADGLRHSKKVTKNGAAYTTLHHWDGQNLVMETNGATGATKGRYLRGVNLIAQEIDGNRFYYTFNAHGDVIQRIRDNGDSAPRYDYDDFGNQQTVNTDPKRVERIW